MKKCMVGGSWSKRSRIYWFVGLLRVATARPRTVTSHVVVVFLVVVRRVQEFKSLRVQNI